MDPRKPLSLLISAFPFVYFTESFSDPREFGNARVEYYKNALAPQGKPDCKPTADELLRDLFASEEELKAFYSILLKEGRVEDREFRLKDQDTARISSRITRMKPGSYCLQGYFAGTTRHQAPPSPVAKTETLHPLPAQDDEKQESDGILGTSRAIEKVVAAVAKIGPLDTPVLLEGEPGCGKKHIAQVIHRTSPRAERPFVTVNCDALSETLLDSELFGHTEGAFAGAEHESVGLIEKAEGGTLYLEELGALPMSVQYKLLRLLQEGEIMPLGSMKSLEADVRLIAGCDGGLEKQVADKTFNEELHRRMQLFALKIPPLREREDDVLLLADHFLQQSGAPNPPALSRSAALALKGQRWPGNIRELKGVVQRAALLCEGGLLTEDHLPLPGPVKTAAPPVAEPPSGSPPKDAGMRQRILDCLEKNRWNKTQTARDLNISRATLWRRIKEFSISSS